MSKDGSITPRTVREKVGWPPLDDKKVESVSEYAERISRHDSQFQAQYTRRNRDALETLKKQALHIEPLLGKLEKYCDGSKFDGLKKAFKSEFNKTAEAISKIGYLRQIEPGQIISSLKSNGSLLVKTVFQHKPKDDKSEIDPSKTMVEHYGINAASSAIFIGCVIKKEELHPIEHSVFSSAVEYLNGKRSAQEYIGMRKEGGGGMPAGQPLPPPSPKPNNVVLVSFFPRKLEDKLLKAKTIVADGEFPKEAETHTIALWKSEEKKIIIIDPTDRGFSKFLEDPDKGAGRGVLGTLFPSYIFKMENSVGGERIYPQTSGPRDCTDIAVKIAFELNEQQADISVPADKILANAIEQISSAKLPGLFKALQSSDVDVRRAAKELINKVKSVEEKSKKSAVLQSLDISGIETLEQIQEVSGLIGELSELLI